MVSWVMSCHCGVTSDFIEPVVAVGTNFAAALSSLSAMSLRASSDSGLGQSVPLPVCHNVINEGDGNAPGTPPPRRLRMVAEIAAVGHRRSNFHARRQVAGIPHHQRHVDELPVERLAVIRQTVLSQDSPWSEVRMTSVVCERPRCSSPCMRRPRASSAYFTLASYSSIRPPWSHAGLG